MRIGVPKEIKAQEYRVGLTPAGVRELCSSGHDVYVETNAGAGVNLSDDAYSAAGAIITASAKETFDCSELIVKVKEPQAEECLLLGEQHFLFTYLHLAADKHQATRLQQSGATCIAYETVTNDKGELPLLAPMSEVAGRLSVQAAAHCLEKVNGGSGVLLAGVPGVAPARVLVLGGGVVGLNAARIALGMGAQVTIIDKSIARLQFIDNLYNGRITTLFSTHETIEAQLQFADAVIGAVLVPGASAPKLVVRTHLKLMKPGSVLVDVAIDQGGCFETSQPTTHSNPSYLVEGLVHYCVANMPGAVATTSTWALTNATLPYILQLANKGLSAFENNQHFAAGINVARGKITHAGVASALNEKFYKPEDLVLGPWPKRA